MNNSKLMPGDTLNPGQSITSANCEYIFEFTKDHHLVVINNATKTVVCNSKDNCPALQNDLKAFRIMQVNGNLVTHVQLPGHSGMIPIWATMTHGSPGAFAETKYWYFKYKPTKYTLEI